jgi:tRNA-binding protein
MSEIISFKDFEKVEVRVGKIEKVEDFIEARNPSYKIWVNFGDEIGIKKSSAQLKMRYSIDDLTGKQVLAVMNFKPRQIANFMSEVLILGIPDGSGSCYLVTTDLDVPLGGKLY